MNTRSEGAKGELEAKQFLIGLGYEILATNFVSKLGEIDIVARDNATVVFIEVKAKSSLRYGYPHEMITEWKIKKIRAVAMMYLKAKHLLNSPVRFDCIEVLSGEITHIKNAF